MMKIFNSILKRKDGLVFQNLSSLAISEVIIRVSKFVVITLAARSLGVVDFGKFNYLLSLAAMVAVIGDLGIGKIITRNIAADRDKSYEYVPTLLLQGLILFLYAIIGFGLFKYNHSELALSFFLLALFTAVNLLSDYIWSFMRGFEKMKSEAIAKAVQAIVILIGGVTVLLTVNTVLSLSIIYVAGALITLGLALNTLRQYLPIRFELDFKSWFLLFKQSWPIAIVAVSAFVFNQIDSIMLGVVGLFDQVGLYNASYRIIGVVTIPMILLNQVLYPRFSSQSIGRAFKIVRQNVLTNLILYTVFLGIVLLFGEQILSLIFSLDYKIAFISLIILSCSLICNVLVFPIANFLIARDYLFINLGLSVSAAIINIVLNLIFIPKFGYNGAAVATFITYGLLLIGYSIAVSKVLTRYRPETDL